MTARHLRVTLSDSLWMALTERCQSSGESMNHAIQMALADALDIEHHTIFQVSTSGALVEGVYQGAVTVADIKRHGDFGLGTFDGLNGEGILLDGIVWQGKSDGSVSQPPDNSLTPFFVATHFQSDSQRIFQAIADMHDLGNRLDALRISGNIFVAIRARGTLQRLLIRACCKVEQGEDLVTATSHQAEFELENISGTIVGIWTPQFARTLNVPGYHFHFLSDDRRHCGHILALSAQQLQVELHTESDLRIVLPETADFLKADLTGDPAAALKQAEEMKEPIR